MKNVNLLFICIFLLSTTVYSQLNMQWSKTFGGSLDDICVNAHNMNDGSYLLVGYTFSSDGDVSHNHGNNDIWIVKVNNQGNIIWEYTIGGPGGEMLFDSKSTNDGGVILVGTKNGSAWIGKLNAEGNLIWENTFDFYSRLTAVTETLDGGFVVAAWKHELWVGSTSSILKLNNSGHLENTINEYQGGTTHRNIRTIIATDDGGYVYGGNINDSYYHFGDSFLVKINSVGETEWSSYNCYDEMSQFYFVKETIDGGYIYGASCGLRKLNHSGLMEWEKSSISGSDLIVLQDGGYLIASSGSIMKINNIGEEEWFLEFEGHTYKHDDVRILQTGNSGYLITGVVETEVIEGYIDYDFLVKKFEDDLSVVDLKEEFIKIYPNPVKHYLNFSKELTNIEIYNLEGAKILNLETSLQIDVSNIPSGTYLLKAIDLSGKNVFSRFIKK